MTRRHADELLTIYTNPTFVNVYSLFHKLTSNPHNLQPHKLAHAVLVESLRGSWNPVAESARSSPTSL